MSEKISLSSEQVGGAKEGARRIELADWYRKLFDANLQDFGNAC